jgi:tetratricopeptide (TPR) repeat protein
MKINNFLTFVILLLSTTLASQAWAQDQEQIKLAQQYDDKGEIEKAKSIYDELAEKKEYVPIIHGRYFRLLVNNGYLEDAEKYMKKTLRHFPGNIIYRLDAGILQDRMGEENAANEYYAEVLSEVQNDPYKIRLVASHFIKSDMLEKAINSYQSGREANQDPNLFALELANVYRRLNEKDKMVLEYLKYADEDEARISYVKNVLQNILTEEEELQSLSDLLLDKIQENPDKQLYNELLIWINLQQKNFYGAFMQARAIDRRNRSDGDRVMEVASIALDNQDYDNALKIYEYVIDKYPRTSNYVSARRYKIKAREEMVKNRYPVEPEDITKLIEAYQNFIDESSKSAIGPSYATLEAMRSQALLYAFYLDERDQAIETLREVAQHPKASRELKAKCKLDMGDIYILINEPWESTLLYSQVEKDHKEEPVGYEAKLRNAKLSYYKGDFELAQGHLDVLKLATTREIANDAMSLSLLIQNNTALDTTGSAMQDYANVELLLFQNKQRQALAKLDSMLNLYENHDLADEIHWLMAKIDMKLGQFDESLQHLNTITESYSYDILGDDALFMTGKIYEDQLQDTDKAMEVYTNFLREHPGSVYIAEVRKRLRNLRGDFNVN